MNASKPSYIFNLCWILRENYSSKHLFDHCMGTLICCIIAGIVFSCFTEPLLFCCDLYKYQLLSLTHNQWCHPIDDCCINVHSHIGSCMTMSRSVFYLHMKFQISRSVVSLLNISMQSYIPNFSIMQLLCSIAIHTGTFLL